ncbi:MAG TPA: hypothetical protein VLA79_20425 [Polyangia bacterium]|nr:hypothetical protein [Polyangia bacterium]
MQTRTTATARSLSVLLIACGTSAAFAMGIQVNRTPLARSADGATLYEVRGQGPEGGGSLSYRVEGPRPGDSADFLVSSDLSPGDGSRPQSVSAEACRQRLAALAGKLVKQKIVGVTLHPEGCQANRRVGLVVVATPAAGGE